MLSLAVAPVEAFVAMGKCPTMPKTDINGLATMLSPTVTESAKTAGMKHLKTFAATLGVDPSDYHYVETYIDDDVSSRDYPYKMEVRFEKTAGCVPVTTACSIEFDLGCSTGPVFDWDLLEVEHRVTKDEIPAAVKSLVQSELAPLGLSIDDCGGFEYSHNIRGTSVTKVQWEHESCHGNDGKHPMDVEVSQLTGSDEWTVNHEYEDKSHPYVHA